MDTTPLILVKGSNTAFDKLEGVIVKANLGYIVIENAEALVTEVDELKPSLIMLDLQIGDKDAIDVLQELERNELRDHLTVVVFGEGDAKYVEIAALNAGADDYLTKPVNKRVFASRLNAWMRRQVRYEKAAGNGRGHSAFHLDRDRFALVVRNRDIVLQRKEFEIVSLLASRPRKVFSRKEIKQTVWGDANGARNRTIDVHITNLRAKIGPGFIRTYKGVGYSFDAPEGAPAVG